MPAQKSQTSPRLAITLVLVWLGIVVSGFWWFQFRDLRQFADNDSVVFFEGNKFNAQLASLVGGNDSQAGHITLVHFWDPGCSCNRFNEPHVKQLIEKYASQPVKFVIVARVADGEQVEAVLQKAKSIFNYPSVVSVVSGRDVMLDSMPSSPAVAVMNQQQLVYFGPYSVGAVCNVANGAFVEKTVTKINSGNISRQVNVLASGCFCSWKNERSVI